VYDMIRSGGKRGEVEVTLGLHCIGVVGYIMVEGHYESRIRLAMTWATVYVGLYR
jgi:hypothetical protein